MKKVMIGACGGLTGLYLAKHLKKIYIPVEVFGFDTSQKNPTKFFIDKFVDSPPFSDENAFIEFLIDVLNKYKIDIYLPTYSLETQIVSKNENKIRQATKAYFIVSNYSTVVSLENKRNAYDNLSRIGLNTPKVYGAQDKKIHFPAFAKPEMSSGSKGTFVINNQYELDLVRNVYPNVIITELISGTEYTVDAVFDEEGQLVAYNQRTRNKTMGGAVIISQNNNEFDCEHEIRRISREFMIKGVCNFQFFVCNGQKIFTDINLRFASGGLPLSVESGVNIPEILIKMMLKEPIHGKYYSDKKNRIMYRYFEEKYEEI